MTSTAIISALAVSTSAQAAESPATLKLSSYSMYGHAGLNLTSTVTVSAAVALNEVYVTFSSPPGTGLTLPTEGIYANPMCRQDAGPGADVVCGPYAVAAGRGFQVLYNPTIPANHLIAHEGAPVRITATVSSPSSDLSGVTPLEYTTPVRSALTFSTTVRRDPVSITTPGSTTLSLRVANGGYSDVEHVTGLFTVPTGLTVRSLPAGCAFAGAASPEGRPVQCTIPYFRWGTLAAFDIPVLVDAGIESDSLTVPDPQWQISSPWEPDGAPHTWTARQVGSPYVLAITGEGEAVGVDTALTLTPPSSGPFGVGTSTSVTFTAANLHETQTASQVVAVFEASGPVADLSTDYPGCTAAGTRIECSLGDIAPSATVSGTVTVQHDADAGPGDVVIDGTLCALETEIDGSDNGARATLEFRAPTPAPTDSATPTPNPTDSATPTPNPTTSQPTTPVPSPSASSVRPDPSVTLPEVGRSEPESTTPTTPAGGLPPTGAGSPTLAWLAFGVLALGMLGVLGARRRHSA